MLDFITLSFIRMFLSAVNEVPHRSVFGSLLFFIDSFDLRRSPYWSIYFFADDIQFCNHLKTEQIRNHNFYETSSCSRNYNLRLNPQKSTILLFVRVCKRFLVVIWQPLKFRKHLKKISKQFYWQTQIRSNVILTWECIYIYFPSSFFFAISTWSKHSLFTWAKYWIY